jgi:hypothetical protein
MEAKLPFCLSDGFVDELNKREYLLKIPSQFFELNVLVKS